MRSRAFIAAPLLASLLACGSKSEAPKSAPRPPLAKADAGAPPAAIALPPLKTHLVAIVGEKSIGPFLAANDSGAMAVYVASFEAGSKRVVAVPLNSAGEPLGTAETIANVPEDVNALVVRPLKGSSGYSILWTTLTDRGEALYAMIVGEDGKPKSTTIEVARTTNDIVWSESIPTDRGTLITWAEETREGSATVFSIAFDVDGKSRHVAGRIVRRASGWQIISAPFGAFLVAQTIPENLKGSSPDARALLLQAIDANGQPRGEPISIAKAEPIAGDVEVVNAFGKTYIAWVQRSKESRSIQMAAFDERGALAMPAKRLVDGGNDLSLVGFKGSSVALLLSWEDTARIGTKRVFLARLSSAANFEGKPAGFLARGKGVPEIALANESVAVLAPMSTCENGTTECEGAKELPTYLRYDASLRLLQREPIAIGGEPAALGWGLSCRTDSTCVALFAANGSPASVHTATLLARSNVTAPKDAPPPPTDAPRLGKPITVLTGDTISDIAAVPLEGATLVATLTSALDDPGKPQKGATLSTRVIANGKVQESQVISPRALSVGGVALAPSDRNDGGAVMAWAARENGDPEVHLTRLDRRGKRINDVQLTTTKGDAGHVAIARVEGGFIVAWVDGRSGNGEVFATKVNSDLGRIVREEKITNAPGDASDLSIVATKNSVWAAWADPRESPDDGFADIFFTALEPHDAKKRFDEIRVVASAPNSRSPEIVATDNAVTIGWIEEAPLGTSIEGAPQYGAMIATFDQAGRTKITPARVRATAPGVLANLSLELAPGGEVRGVVSRAAQENLWLDTLSIGTASSQAFPLVELHAPPSFDGPLFLLNGRLFFTDDGPSAQDRRVNFAEIEWKR